MTKLDDLIKSLPPTHNLKLPASWQIIVEVSTRRAIAKDDKGLLFLVGRDNPDVDWSCMSPPISAETIVRMIPFVLEGGDHRIITWSHTMRIMALAAYLGLHDVLED